MESDTEICAIVAIDIRLRSHGGDGGKPPRARDCWIFTLDNPRALGEVEACSRALAEEHDGRWSRLVASDGSPIFLVTASTLAPAPWGLAGKPEDPLRSSTVVFAALHAWGCGPHSGTRELGPLDPWTPEALEARLASWLLAAHAPAPLHSARLRRAL